MLKFVAYLVAPWSMKFSPLDLGHPVEILRERSAPLHAGILGALPRGKRISAEIFRMTLEIFSGGGSLNSWILCNPRVALARGLPGLGSSDKTINTLTEAWRSALIKRIYVRPRNWSELVLRSINYGKSSAWSWRQVERGISEPPLKMDVSKEKTLNSVVFHLENLKYSAVSGDLKDLPSFETNRGINQGV